MKRYMLDTNTVSHLIKEHPAVSRRLVSTSMAFLCVSTITKGELLFGLAKRPDTKRLHLAVRELLRRVVCCLGTVPLGSTMDLCGLIWSVKAEYWRRLIC